MTYTTPLPILVAIFLFSAGLGPASGEICPDLTALHNVSAHFNYDVDSRTEFKEDINLYHLENHTVIHVTRANVSILCEGMVNSFRYLQNLALTNANITKILPEAFKQVPRLTSLSLAVNRLVVVKRDHFRNLPGLIVLYLSANRIETIDDDAFADLVNIRKIYLDKNRIYEINEGWFLDNPEISLVNLAFNGISKLQREAFTVRRNASLELRLQHNSIEEMVPGAVVCEETVMEDKPRLIVGVDHNNITEIPLGFITSLTNFNSVVSLNSNIIKCVPDEVLEELKTSLVDLRLTRNPLNCNCMYDMVKFIDKNIIQGNFVYNSTLECSLYGFSTLN